MGIDVTVYCYFGWRLRGMSKDEFEDLEEKIDEIEELGYDVIYDTMVDYNVIIGNRLGIIREPGYSEDDEQVVDMGEERDLDLDNETMPVDLYELTKLKIFLERPRLYMEVLSE